MTSTLETIALIITLGVAVTTTIVETSVDAEVTTVLCSEPGGSGVNPPPPQN
ncbi:MAG: hypothetical protein AB1728_14005 [Bacteroidota bacterium]